MKLAGKISLIINGLLTAVIGAAVPYFIDLYFANRELNEENQEKKEQIVKRNEVIERYYNEFNELIEEHEVCVTTKEKVSQRLRNEASELNSVINEYDMILDSVVSRDLIEVENLPHLEPLQRDHL